MSSRLLKISLGVLVLGLGAEGAVYAQVVVGHQSAIAPGARLEQQNGNALSDAARLEREGEKLLFDEGDFDAALQKFSDARKFRDSVSASDPSVQAGLLIDIALAYRAKGKYELAEQSFERALLVKEGAVGKDHVELVPILKRYSCLLRGLNRTNEAKALNERAAQITADKNRRTGPVTGTVIEGKLIKLSQPPYPPYARKWKLAGSVTALVIIGEDGHVLESCATSGPPALALAAEKAAMKAVFSPTTLDGEPVKVTGAISFNFVAR